MPSRSASPARSKSPARSSPAAKPKEASPLVALKLLDPLDPTLVFLVSTLVSVLFIDADDAAKTLTMRPPPLADAVRFFVDPAMALGVAELALFLWLVSKKPAKQLTRGQSLAMGWHLWNGIFSYTIMDGLCGAFAEYGFMPLLHAQYRNVDRRYRRHLMGQPGGPTVYEAYVARTVNTMEVALYSWMSIASAVGIATGAKWHRTLETIVLTMAAYGAVVFVVPDMFDGCVNMQPMGVADCAPPLTPFYFFFVYFGVVINWIWLVVPVAMLVAKVRRGI